MNNKIKKLIDSYKYISFDIFDTLIKRNVSKPSYIYDLVESKYFDRLDMKNFSSKRLQSEYNLWKSKKYQNFDYENIYNNIGLVENKREIMDYEQWLEYNLSTCNMAIKEVYDYCLLTNKKIVLISNMYHNSGFITKLLNKNGFKKFYKLYVSSECGCTKDEGLFNYVLNDLNISNTQILHIGNELKSDYIIPKLMGIRSYKINVENNLWYKNKNVNTLGDDMLCNLINNNVVRFLNPYRRIGYEALGPLLFGFSTWLNTNIKAENINTILFFSRDGFIMKKAYDLIFGEEKSIKTKYFLVSRRSVVIPLLDTINNFLDVLDYVKYRKFEKFEDILFKLGINKLHADDQNIKNLLVDRDKLKFNTELLERLNKYIFEIKNNAKKEKEAFLKYFKENVNDKKIAVVDIGWHGTTQDAIKKILISAGITCEIKGFYLGLEQKCDINKKSYVFDITSKKYDSSMICNYRGLIETFFSANHGSVIKYTCLSNKVKVLYQQKTISKETELIVKQIHLGAMECVKNFNNIIKKNIKIQLSSDYTFSHMWRLLMKPTNKDIQLFKNIDFNDTNNRKLLPKRSLLFYLFNFKCFIRDYIDCDYRIGFIKKYFKVNSIFLLKITKIFKK